MSAQLPIKIRVLLLLVVLLVLLGMTAAQPGRKSFEELRQLLQQQQQQDQSELHENSEQQFQDELNLWLQSLDQVGLVFASVVEECRPLGTRCSQRQVQRHLRSLRRSYSDLRAQLETLEMSYVGKVSDEQLLTPTLRAVRRVLQQYEHTLRQVNAEAYKLVNQ